MPVLIPRVPYRCILLTVFCRILGLSHKVLSIAITSANKEVKSVVQLPAKRAKGPYTKFTAEQREAIGKRATEDGVAATVHYYER